MKYKLCITYDGSSYHGWQIQPNGTSIQALIQEALSTILREQVGLIGAGRTDAGVHALGQVAHFNTSKECDLQRLQRSLNGILPPDIRVISAEKVSENFHAQYSAISKIYQYHLYLNQVLSPFFRKYVWHIPWPLDLNQMQKAAAYLVGLHDFSSFANEAHAGVAARNPVRNLTRLDFVAREGGIVLEFEANGFLYKMVRNIVGTLVECGSGKLLPEEIPNILSVKDRKKAGMAAPSEGLFLVKIKYP